jgi:integral membrane sensor domain MASE1
VQDDTMMWLIGFIVGILILAITGSLLWKKANRLDSASDKDNTRFFIQNQLGAILGVLAFLPMVFVIFTNKEMSGKTKDIAGSIGVVANCKILLNIMVINRTDYMYNYRTSNT